jgi:hypothetical protein
MEGEGFLTDADKNDLAGVTGKAREVKINELRQKFMDETTRMELRSNRLTGDLREKPMSFNADSLAKSGLYSASALQFNPVLGLQQQANAYLRQIVSNTSHRGSVQPPKRNSFGDKPASQTIGDIITGKLY